MEWAAGLYHHETNPERDIVLKEAYYKRLKAGGGGRGNGLVESTVTRWSRAEL